ncbi:conserved hypothetical protein [Vibrio chagasii]|nr:conserved hypothetical protein [Vibrio chagasii]CAH7321388.1 conserved hypothetical protein [Vibrio chagasii]
MNKSNLSLENFLECQWDVVSIDIRSMYDYERNHHIQEMINSEDRPEVIEVLTLLQRASSMVLEPSSINCPYQALYNNHKDGSRTNLPEDFTPDEIDFFKSILESIEETWLSARLSDIVWLCDKPRNPLYARLAITSYIQNEINIDRWINEQVMYWERAARLCLQLKDINNLNKIEDSVYSALLEDYPDNTLANLWLASFLDKLYIARDKFENIAQKLLFIATNLKDEGNYNASRLYLELTEKIYFKLSDNVKWLDCLLMCAECYELEADSRSQNSNMVANSFIEKAIQAYRRVPTKFRLDHDVENKISNLRHKLSISGKSSVEEMGIVSLPGVDIKDLVQMSKEHVSNKSSLQLALLYFSGVSTITNYASLEADAAKILSEFSLKSMFGSVHVASDGRVIAKTPALTLNKDKESYKDNLHAQMIQNFKFGISIACKGQILPSLDEILLEYRITKDYLEALCFHAPIVPVGREKLLATALWLGFEYDFSNAIHLLCPQLENIVRTQLKENGAHTSNVDPEGIEHENGLSTLMDIALVDDIFGQDLAFEIKAIFTDSLGANLRNEVAHGLLDDNSAGSTEAIYGWWLILRMVIRSLAK